MRRCSESMGGPVGLGLEPVREARQRDMDGRRRPPSVWGIGNASEILWCDAEDGLLGELIAFFAIDLASEVGKQAERQHAQRRRLRREAKVAEAAGRLAGGGGTPALRRLDNDDFGARTGLGSEVAGQHERLPLGEQTVGGNQADDTGAEDDDGLGAVGVGVSVGADVGVLWLGPGIAHGEDAIEKQEDDRGPQAAAGADAHINARHG